MFEYVVQDHHIKTARLQVSLNWVRPPRVGETGMFRWQLPQHRTRLPTIQPSRRVTRKYPPPQPKSSKRLRVE